LSGLASRRTGAVDPEDLRAQVCQQHRAERAGPDASKLDDAQSG
jgi:hypothetical protein